MSGRFNNRTLLLVFVGLAALLIITRYTGVRQSERTLITDLAVIDTSQVTKFSIFPMAEGGQEIRFTREGNAWRVQLGETSAPANLTGIRSVLTEIGSLEAQQLVARDPERWEEYQVVDSMGTRVVISEGSKVTLDMVVGRFQYQPPPQDSYNMYGQNQVSGKTYIRISGEEEVYSVDGFFALSVNQSFDRWRDNALSRVNQALLSRIHFNYPSDSGFIAQKSADGWMVAGLPADSAAMESYLNRISRTSFSDFADGFHPSGDPDFQLTLEGEQMSPVMVKAYARGDSTFIFNSTQNPETWFRNNDPERFGEIFPGSATLLAGRR
jgi:hypothetical protein